MTKNLVLAGNFNMTNNDELFQKLIELGQHPENRTDTVTVMEKIGHFQDEEVEKLFQLYNKEVTSSNKAATCKTIAYPSKMPIVNNTKPEI